MNDDELYDELRLWRTVVLLAVYVVAFLFVLKWVINKPLLDNLLTLVFLTALIVFFGLLATGIVAVAAFVGSCVLRFIGLEKTAKSAQDALGSDSMMSILYAACTATPVLFLALFIWKILV